MIDIHCHILPGIDDGASDMEQAIVMAVLAVEEGISTIVATPHHANGKYSNERDDILHAVRGLNHELDSRGVPLQVLAGQEVRLFDELIRDLSDGPVIPLGDSPYLLLEFPSSHIPGSAAETIHELELLGIIPIIAHPERNREIAKDPDQLAALIALGALSQVTAQSVTGGMGKKIRDVTLQLCRRNLVHFIASDAHDPVFRPFGLRQAYAAIEHRLGKSFADYYRYNAEAVVAGHPIDAHLAMKPKKHPILFWR